MKVAFYKGTHSGFIGIYNRLVRWWTRSMYSHAELVFQDGMSASSSYMDGGVRFKQITFEEDLWDFVELPAHLEPAAREWFVANSGASYDLLGNIHFVVSPVKDSKRKWFCSESIAAALGFTDPWRYDPGVLASVLRNFTRESK